MTVDEERIAEAEASVRAPPPPVATPPTATTPPASGAAADGSARGGKPGTAAASAGAGERLGAGERSVIALALRPPALAPLVAPERGGVDVFTIGLACSIRGEPDDGSSLR
eukprot:10881544-Alexandrium_andersonii.AAC.1